MDAPDTVILRRDAPQLAPGLENGYARLTAVEGDDSFFAYSVLNDGPAPNTGTGDGSFVPMVVSP